MRVSEILPHELTFRTTVSSMAQFNLCTNRTQGYMKGASPGCWCCGAEGGKPRLLTTRLWNASGQLSTVLWDLTASVSIISRANIQSHKNSNDVWPVPEDPSPLSSVPSFAGYVNLAKITLILFGLLLMQRNFNTVRFLVLCDHTWLKTPVSFCSFSGSRHLSPDKSSKHFCSIFLAFVSSLESKNSMYMQVYIYIIMYRHMHPHTY